MRTYPYGKDKFYSVTTILGKTKPKKTEDALEAWKDRVGEDKAKFTLDTACIRGTATHTLCEQYLLGQPLDLSYKPVLPYWDSLKPALSQVSNTIYTEEKVYHPTLRYAGTLDCFATFRGIDHTLIDFKTADKPKKVEWIIDYFIQVSAYAGALKKTHGLPTNQAAVIIGIPNQKAQTFVLNKVTLLFYWNEWLKRVEKFHKQNNLPLAQ